MEERHIDPEPPLRYANGFMEGFGLGCIVTIIIILMV